MDSPSLKVAHLSYSFPEREGEFQLEDISFEAPLGKITGLVGPNGSGKSTLLKRIAGLLPNSQSVQKIVLGEDDLDSLSVRERARKVVYVGSDFPVGFPLTVFEAVRLGLYSHSPGLGREALSSSQVQSIEEALEVMDCLTLRNRRIDHLSGGERQRVLMARSWVQGSSVFLIDETFSKMDFDHQAMMADALEKLAKRGRGVIWVSHDLNLLMEWSDLCCVLDHGRLIAQGCPKNVITQSLLKHLYPRASMSVTESPSSRSIRIFLDRPSSHKP